MTREGKLQVFAWGLSALVAAVAFAAWGGLIGWEFKDLSSYFLFPLFGLLAFSIMWSHYIAAAVRMYLGVEKKVLKDYFEATSLIVLTLILLHPGLLALQLWSDGQGLPPASELNYVEPAAKWAVVLALTALTIFLIYELRRWYDQRSWWKYVGYATDAAMIMIFIHSLRLGGVLMSSWLRPVWYFYGLTFLIALVYIHWRKHQPR